MKIVVKIKQVPARDSQLHISGKWIEDADLSYEINEPDAYALEAGLQLKEKHGGGVHAPCAGQSRGAWTIPHALGQGARRAVAGGSDHPRGAGEGRGPGDPHRGRRARFVGSVGVGETAGGGAESG